FKKDICSLLPGGKARNPSSAGCQDAVNLTLHGRTPSHWVRRARSCGPSALGGACPFHADATGSDEPDVLSDPSCRLIARSLEVNNLLLSRVCLFSLVASPARKPAVP